MVKFVNNGQILQILNGEILPFLPPLDSHEDTAKFPFVGSSPFLQIPFALQIIKCELYINAMLTSVERKSLSFFPS